MEKKECEEFLSRLQGLYKILHSWKSLEFKFAMQFSS